MAADKESVRFVQAAGLPDVTAVFGENVGNSFGRHIHECWVLGLVDAGMREVRLARETVLVPEGAAFVIAPGLAHGCGPGYAGRQSYRALCISRSRMQDAARGMGLAEGADPVFSRVGIQDAHLAGLFEAFFTLLDSGLALERDSALLEILDRLLTRYGGAAGAGARDGVATDVPANILRVRQHLLDHCTENVRLDDLAGVADRSPMYMQRMFVAHFGVSPLEFMLQRRIALATGLLAEGVCAADAAAAAGFCDQSHFIRHFKRIVGVTPGRFVPKSSPAL